MAAWHQTVGCMTDKVKAVVVNLMGWQKLRKKELFSQKRFLQQKLEEYMQGSLNDLHEAEMHAYKTELNEILNKEESFWQQCSRVLWFREGDHNKKISCESHM
ncbi:hypothetical protein V6N11_029302 [Hibiscus sabdariffa]|uniref:Uncharacterized protein n=2 Tax=Hibiscus sabdariffa TaxID=183260 RepID=A0ABR2NER7_9ROSI